MTKEKFDFEKYLAWCEEKHLLASESESLALYKTELEKVAQTGEKERKIAEQKQVFNSIADYLGKKAKYTEEAYEFIDTILEGMLFAVTFGTVIDKNQKSIDKVLEDFGMEGKQ